MLSHSTTTPKTPQLIARKESMRLYSDDKEIDLKSNFGDNHSSYFGSTLNVGGISQMGGANPNLAGSMMSLNTTYTTGAESNYSGVTATSRQRPDLASLVEASEMAESQFDLESTIDNRTEYNMNIDDFDKESVVTQLSVHSTIAPTESTSGYHSKNKSNQHSAAYRLANSIELNTTIYQAAKAVFSRFVVLLGQWPLGNSPSIFGASFMNEMSDQFNGGGSHYASAAISNTNLSIRSVNNRSKTNSGAIISKAPDLSRDLFDSPSTTFLCYNDCIVSVIELENSDLQEDVPENFNLPTKTTRFIIRNAMGKFVWDTVQLESPELLQKVQVKESHVDENSKDEKKKKTQNTQNTHQNRENQPTDKLNSLLNFITKSSPETITASRRANNLSLDTPSLTLPDAIESQTEHDIMETLRAQISITEEVTSIENAFTSSKIPRASKK